MKYSVTAAAAALLSAAVFAGAGAAFDPARVEMTGVTGRNPLSCRAGETIICMPVRTKSRCSGFTAAPASGALPGPALRSGR